MRKARFSLIAALCALPLAAAFAADLAASDARSLWRGFSNPPQESRPWCYWWWVNGNVDEETIAKDLEDIKALGFGGVLMFDVRGYGSVHLKPPPVRHEVLSPEWVKLAAFSIRECARLGLEFTMNISACGGKLMGAEPVGEDAPKRLVALETPIDGETRIDLAKPGKMRRYRDIAIFAVKHASDVAAMKGWKNIGGVTERWAKDVEKPLRPALDVVDVTGRDSFAPPHGEGKWTLLRIGYALMDGHDRDVDVIDRKAVAGHFNRFAGPILADIGELAGKTLTHFYSVSWEGAVPTWTDAFEEEFAKRAGFGIKEFLPVLAGWKMPDGKGAEILKKYRRVRNDMFRDNFYGTMRDLSHERGIRWYSESGGPWNRGPSVFKEADQFEFLAVNDMPMGEFWLAAPHHPIVYHTRAAANAAHIYGRRRAAAEAFTHMVQHWSAYPDALKNRADCAFADGINHFVWHTYTSSPDSFGKPGIEYFAGTHINRNVTWHDQAAGFIRYIGRCQFMLQQGESVVDLWYPSGGSSYVHWGRYRDKTPSEAAPGNDIPVGYNYDLLNDDVLKGAKRKDGFLVLASGMKYPLERPLPDCEGPFAFAHRRTDDGTDIYFLQGEGVAVVTFRVHGKAAEIWDAVSGKRRGVAGEETADGRTRLPVSLPKNGSAFVVFRPKREIPVIGLGDWTQDPEWRHFSGTRVLKASFTLTADEVAEYGRLSLCDVLASVVDVRVNGKDCGTLWCTPWEADVSGALLEGRNELELRVTNTWKNRLIHEASLPPSERQVSTMVNLWDGTSGKKNQRVNHAWKGYSSTDKLQRCGVIAPVFIW